MGSQSMNAKRLGELRAIFAKRAAKGMQSYPIATYEAGDLELLAEALAELSRFRETFGSEVK